MPQVGGQVDEFEFGAVQIAMQQQEQQQQVMDLEGPRDGPRGSSSEDRGGEDTGDESFVLEAGEGERRRRRRRRRLLGWWVAGGSWWQSTGGKSAKWAVHQREGLAAERGGRRAEPASTRLLAQPQQ
jgi:hypothetical protein